MLLSIQHFTLAHVLAVVIHMKTLADEFLIVISPAHILSEKNGKLPDSEVHERHLAYHSSRFRSQEESKYGLLSPGLQQKFEYSYLYILALDV